MKRLQQPPFGKYVWKEHSRVNTRVKHSVLSFISPLNCKAYTRITSTSATLIDNIFTNNYVDVNSSITITDISDHFPKVTSIKLNFPKNKDLNSEPTYERSFRLAQVCICWLISVTWRKKFYFFLLNQHVTSPETKL